MFQTPSTVQTIPATTAAEGMWYSVPILSSQEHEINMITLCQLHTATCIQDATAWIPDASSAFSRIPPSAGTDVQSTSELYTHILYLYCQFMSVWNAPSRLLKPWPFTRVYVKRLIWQLCNCWFCWQLYMYYFFHVMLNSWCCNYVITDFVNNYVCITFFLGYNYVCYCHYLV